MTGRRPTLDDAVDYQAIRSSLTELQRRLPDVRHTEWSPDGLVEVTIDGRGELLELRLDQRVMRTPDAAALARDIAATVERALAAVHDTVHRLTLTVLADAAVR